jgi:hypothetical protein
MAIWKRAGSALCAAAAFAAVVGLSATPAIAAAAVAPKLTVKVSSGGSISGTAKTTTLTDQTKIGPVNVTCITKKSPASTAKGAIPSRTTKGTAPVAVGSAPKLSFNNCTGPLGAVTTKVMSAGKTGYTIAVDSKTVKGLTDGIIGPVKVSVQMKGCSFTVTGTASGYFNNKTHQLFVTNKLPVKPDAKSQLTISGLPSAGCLNLVFNGQHPTYVGTYSLGKSKISVQSS